MAAERNVPGWARREREQDLSWIKKNLYVFEVAAKIAYEGTDRGAIVVDTTIQPLPDSGHPLAYFSQKQIERDDDEDIKRMDWQYGQDHELIPVLLKE